MARRGIIGQISWARSETHFSVPAPIEQEICDSLGPEVSQIIKNLLSQWHSHIRGRIEGLPYRYVTSSLS